MAEQKKRLWLRVLGILAFLAVLLAAGWLVYFWKNPLAVYESATRRTLAKIGLERKELATDAGRLAYWQGGEGDLLVLVHGAGHQAGAWSIVAEDLVQGYELLIVDLPGHGESEPSEGVLSMDVLYGGLETLLNSDMMREPPVMVGNSLGAWLGMVYAQRNPNGLARLVALNGGAVVNDPGDLNLVPTTRAEARHLVNGLRDPASEFIPDFVLDDLVERSAAGPVSRMLLDLDGMLEYLLNDRIAEIETPVDLLWGESDQLMDLEYASYMDNLLPRSRLTPIPSCGHIPHTECPERFVEILETILSLPPPTAVEPEPEGP